MRLGCEMTKHIGCFTDCFFVRVSLFWWANQQPDCRKLMVTLQPELLRQQETQCAARRAAESRCRQVAWSPLHRHRRRQLQCFQIPPRVKCVRPGVVKTPLQLHKAPCSTEVRSDPSPFSGASCSGPNSKLKAQCLAAPPAFRPTQSSLNLRHRWSRAITIRIWRAWLVVQHHSFWLCSFVLERFHS